MVAMNNAKCAVCGDDLDRLETEDGDLCTLCELDDLVQSEMDRDCE